MNLHELDELIQSFDPVEDKHIIDFYKKKRKELIKEISNKVKLSLMGVNYN